MAKIQSRVVVIFSDGSSDAQRLGTVWRFTAKQSDFYLEPLGGEGAPELHLSMHAPRRNHASHRFHIKIDEASVERCRERGDSFIEHALPPEGHVVSGYPVSKRTYLVTRMRWLSVLRNPLYREAALPRASLPEMEPTDQGIRLNEPLAPTKAWDLDVFVAFDRPYIPPRTRRTVGIGYLGPLLANKAQMYLTAVSQQHTLAHFPNPEDLVPPPPTSEETPNQLLCGAPDPTGQIYWWVETITSREFLNSRTAEPAGDAN